MIRLHDRRERVDVAELGADDGPRIEGGSLCEVRQNGRGRQRGLDQRLRRQNQGNRSTVTLSKLLAVWFLQLYAIVADV
jgi:hypothetical protein